VLRQGLAENPADFWLAHELGSLLNKGKRWGEAEGYYRVALGLRPDSPGVWLNLGAALANQGKADEAVACFRRAIQLDPKYAMAHNNLGNTLKQQGKLDEAVTCSRRAIELDPKLAQAHCNLGNALKQQGKLDDAVTCYRRAIQLDPKYAQAHYNLGNALMQQGKLDDAVACYRRAIDLDPKLAQAHCNLGHALRDLGRFPEALAALKQGHELGSKSSGWRFPSAAWVSDCQRLVELDARLPGLLDGTDQPADDAERLGFIEVYRLTQRFAAAARLSVEAFASRPGLAADLGASHRYNAACSAAQAGCGQGADAAGLTPADRLRWRRQALSWLRNDLAAWGRVLVSGDAKAGPLVAENMRYWQADADLAGLRDPAELAKLSAEERAACERLWADVAALLQQAQARK
jgi:tetratricopeptide (TPR) repeat protein